MTETIKNICIAAWYGRRIVEADLTTLVGKGKLTSGEKAEVMASSQKPL